MQPEERPWARLPATVVRELSAHLSRSSLRNAALVCTSWKDPLLSATQRFAISLPESSEDGRWEQKIVTVAKLFPHLTCLKLSAFDHGSCSRLLFEPLHQHLHYINSMEVVVVCSEYPVTFRAIPELLQFNQLRSLTLSLDHICTLRDLSDLSTLTSLTDLTLHLQIVRGWAEDEFDLLCLSGLTGLTAFSLCTRYEDDVFDVPISLSGSTIARLATSWPQLGSLSLIVPTVAFSADFSQSLSKFQRLAALTIAAEDSTLSNHTPDNLQIWAQYLPASLNYLSLTTIKLVMPKTEAPMMQQLRALELLDCDFDTELLSAWFGNHDKLERCVVDRKPCRIRWA